VCVLQVFVWKYFKSTEKVQHSIQRNPSTFNIFSNCILSLSISTSILLHSIFLFLPAYFCSKFLISNSNCTDIRRMFIRWHPMILIFVFLYILPFITIFCASWNLSQYGYKSDQALHIILNKLMFLLLYWKKFSSKIDLNLKPAISAGLHWLTPVILGTQEAEIRRLTIQSQSRQIVCKTLSWK
jgi:hypothetical protein